MNNSFDAKAIEDLYKQGREEGKKQARTRCLYPAMIDRPVINAWESGFKDATILFHEKKLCSCKEGGDL